MHDGLRCHEGLHPHFAPHQVEQYVHHFRRHGLRHGEAGDDIGSVFVVCQHLVQYVGGVLVAGIDRGAPDFGLLETVRMQRNKQVRLVGAGQLHPLFQSQIGIVFTGQRHVEPPRFDQQFLQAQ